MPKLKLFNKGTILDVTSNPSLKNYPYLFKDRATSFNRWSGGGFLRDLGGSAEGAEYIDKYRLLLQGYHVFSEHPDLEGENIRPLLWWAGHEPNPVPHEDDYENYKHNFLRNGRENSITLSTAWNITAQFEDNGSEAAMETNGFGYLRYKERHAMYYNGNSFNVNNYTTTDAIEKVSQDNLDPGLFDKVFNSGYVGDENPTQEYKYDFTFSLDVPGPLPGWYYPPKDLSMIEPSHFTIKPVYNYYIKEYEEALDKFAEKNWNGSTEREGVLFQEHIYPNYYAFIYKDLSDEKRGALSTQPSTLNWHKNYAGGTGISPEVDDTTSIAKVYKFIQLSRDPFQADPDPGFGIYARPNRFFELEQLNPEDNQGSDWGNNRKYKSKSRGGYFKKWSKRYSEIMATDVGAGGYQQTFSSIGNPFRNIIIPGDSVELLKRHNEKKHMFPLYNEISFSTDKQTQFSRMLSETGVMAALMEKVACDVYSYEQMHPDRLDEAAAWNDSVNKGIASKEPMTLVPADPDWSSIAVENWSEEHKDAAENMRAIRGAQYENTSGFRPIIPTEAGVKMWDVMQWWKKFKENNGEHWPNALPIAPNSTSIPIINLGFNDKFIFKDNINSKLPSFAKAMDLWVCDKKLKQMTAEHLRTYKEILTNSRETYSETIFYRVAKHEDQNGLPTDRPVQSYFFGNSSDIDVINFIDTQVRYKEKYHYKVYAYRLVVGSKYKFLKHISSGATSGGATSNAASPWHQKDFTEDSDGVKFTAKAFIYSEPCLKLVEVPYAKTTSPIAIMDSPPLWPDVQVIPYRGVDNRLLFTFNGNIGEYKADPFLFEGDDSTVIEAFQKLSDEPYIHEDYRLPGNTVKYRTDDPPSEFQIYRIDKMPSSYDDFRREAPVGTAITQYSTEQKGIGNTSTVESTAKVMRASSATFVDDIKPNKKYYYTFRTVDLHGNFSNPSPVYQVELINDAGFVYPLIEIFDMDLTEAYETNKVKSPMKTAKKYIEITPSFAQGHIDLERSTEGEGNVIMGIEDTSLWEYDGTNGKIFKIRITSRSTGRMFDLNVKFNHKHTGLKPEAT